MNGYTTVQLAERAGVTFTTIDKWERNGHLLPSIQRANGSGSRRRYSLDDLRLAVMLAALNPACNGGSATLRRLRALVAASFRSNPDASFFVILDGRSVVACDTIEQAAATTHNATVSTLLWPDRLLGVR